MAPRGDGDQRHSFPALVRPCHALAVVMLFRVMAAGSLAAAAAAKAGVEPVAARAGDPRRTAVALDGPPPQPAMVRSQASRQASSLLALGRSSGDLVAVRPRSVAPQKNESLARKGSVALHDQGGTACRCICGNRVIWHREIFSGNVKEEKELECEEEICPKHQIPGLKVEAQCTYVSDMKELTAGTVCQCQCGEKVAWRNRAFYGNVVQDKEAQCIKNVCPQVNPVPGMRFEARCVYDPDLFAEHRYGGRPMIGQATRCALPAAVSLAAAAGGWAALSRELR